MCSGLLRDLSSGLVITSIDGIYLSGHRRYSEPIRLQPETQTTKSLPQPDAEVLALVYLLSL
jgi:hypothetical protein